MKTKCLENVNKKCICVLLFVSYLIAQGFMAHTVQNSENMELTPEEEKNPHFYSEIQTVQNMQLQMWLQMKFL